MRRFAGLMATACLLVGVSAYYFAYPHVRTLREECAVATSARSLRPGNGPYSSSVVSPSINKVDHGSVPNKPPVYVLNIEKSASDTTAVERLKRSILACADVSCHILHLNQCSKKALDQDKPVAVFIGGQKTPWWEYTEAELQGVTEMLRTVEVPVLGICGGHQLLAKVFGGEVAPIEKLRSQIGPGYAGCLREKGWIKISITRDDPLFLCLSQSIVVWENHCEEVKEVPADFVELARGSRCHVQAMRHRLKPIYGVQFHPEIESGRNKQGQTCLRNFVSLAGLPSTNTDN